MNPEARFRELLSKLLAGDFSAEERNELACLCDDEESFRESLRAELEMDELIRLAASPSSVADETFSHSLDSRISGEMPEFEELTHRLIESEAAEDEVDELARLCRRDEESANRLRRDLKWADLLGQAASDRRSEEAFVESLATRMWAEQEEDPFVEQTQSKIVRMFPDSAQPTEPERGSSKVITLGTWMTAAAAMIALGLFVLMNRPGVSVAKIVNTTEDVRWKEGPGKSGHLTKGTYALESGVVILGFANGTEMTIEGPAEFDLRGENAAFVHTGIAMLDQHNRSANASDPDVSAGSKPGFTLQSRGLNLVDTHDTVGIDARNAYATEAVVFNGGAEICLPIVSGSCRHLYEYEAVRVDLKREKVFDIPYNPKVFSRSWEVLAGVESNSGSVRIELPGEKPDQADPGEEEVQVFVERDRFVADKTIEVDTLNPGQFASASGAKGVALEEKGELRSYLLQLWPEDSDTGDAELEASVTFAHEVVGVIYSSERLEQSDSIVGSNVSSLDPDDSAVRGLDGSETQGDSILLSDDRRTVNLRLQSGSESDELDQVRVLVALR